jgi:hypothetical protein
MRAVTLLVLPNQADARERGGNQQNGDREKSQKQRTYRPKLCLAVPESTETLWPRLIRSWTVEAGMESSTVTSTPFSRLDWLSTATWESSPRKKSQKINRRRWYAGCLGVVTVWGVGLCSELILAAGAGEDHGIDHNKNWLRFPYVIHIVPVP